MEAAPPMALPIRSKDCFCCSWPCLATSMNALGLVTRSTRKPTRVSTSAPTKIVCPSIIHLPFEFALLAVYRSTRRGVFQLRLVRLHRSEVLRHHGLRRDQ